MNRIGITLCVLCMLITSCKKGKTELKPDVLFSEITPEFSGIEFFNKIENEKDLNIFTYRNFYNGGGVAIGDINNDGLPDIYFTANQGKNKLYLNKGNFKFEDISKAANIEGSNIWSTGVVMVDINNDGFLDIYVCNAGNVKGDNLKNELFINNGNLTFTEKAEDYNLAENGLTTHAAFFDYDKDGDLDAYILNNSFIPVNSLNYSNKRGLRAKDWDVSSILKGGGDKLLRNDNGKFVDVSEEAGIFGSLIGFGLGVTIGDVNSDGYPDIYVSNDFYERDYLYINNQDATFTESVEEWTPHLSQSSMGADMADINNDGKLDVFVTDMLPEHNSRIKETTMFESYDIYRRKLGLEFDHQFMQNSLQLNLDGNRFAEIANLSGVAKTDWSWGALLFDMDNDGLKDIFVCNGIYHDLTNQDFMNFFANDIIQNMVLTGKKEEVSNIINKMPSTPITNYAFNNKGNLMFDNVSLDWGFDRKTFSNGAAYGDLDNDGDLDLVISNVNQQALVYQNNSNKLTSNRFIKVKLKGDGQNLYGVGSTIKIFAEGEVIMQEVMPSRGFQSSIDYVQTIGIGQRPIDSLVVIWPDDSSETKLQIKPNSTYIFNKAEALHKHKIPSSTVPKILAEIKNKTFEAHRENNHVDFNYEGLIYQMLSQEGPTIAVGDVNNDGLEDAFIGGSKGQSGKIYLQSSSGQFYPSKSNDIANHKDLEDTASAFFDADKDGDLDLIVGTGGNQIEDEKKYINRLYLNNGKGQFSESTHSITSTYHNASVIAPNDFDNDGDIDLFIGSRSVPAVYGINAKHLLLENDGFGNFKNITKNKAYAFRNLGMITDAQWHDINADGTDDLVLVEDWGSLKLFTNNGKQLKPVNSNLNDIKGWWNTVKIADINNDKIPDFILGNSGLNLPYKPSKAKPLKIYINDFDNNGTMEQIVTESIGGKDVPIITKHELTAQIVSLKKQNLKFSDYAHKSIDELFPKEVIDQSIAREVNTSESVVALSDATGNYQIRQLPLQAQFSCINDMALIDVNNDSHLDIIFGGNNFALKPQFSRLDSNYGGVLLGDGQGRFKWTKYENSGFFIEGVIRDITPIKTKNETLIIVGINNDYPKLFKINNE